MTTCLRTNGGFDLSEHEVTVEYKKETKKWFLVVRRKRNKMRRGLRESEKKVLMALALAPVQHNLRNLRRQVNTDLWLDGVTSTEELRKRMSVRIERRRI